MTPRTPFYRLIAVLSLTACLGGGVNVATLSPAPPSLLVASKISVPLYIVLDASRVNPQYEVERIGAITNMHAFVTRDLKKTMGDYFERVEIVGQASEISAERFVLADVKIDQIVKRSVSAGTASYSVFDMTWSFAVRTSDAKEYLFSFAGIAESNLRASSGKDVVSGMLEHALTGLLKKWAESGTFGKLQQWGS